MATMNISLPDKMKKWVEKQVASGRYANASDYMRDLVRRQQDEARERKAALAELQVLVDEGLEGKASDIDFDAIRSEVKRDLERSQESDAA